MTSPDDVTALLARWNSGDEAALDALVPLVHHELHRLAASQMRRERPGHFLQTTALVNEAYLRLRDADGVRWQNRSHFYAVAARAMRRILVDLARAQRRQKRHGGHQVDLDEALAVTGERSGDVLALDEALTRLAALSERQGRIVELRFFGGLTEPQIAEVLGLSPRTISGEWRLARAWLLRELSAPEEPSATRRNDGHDA